MRDIVAAVEPQEIRDVVGATWQTDTFRDSHADPKGYIRRVVDELVGLPRLFCELDEPSFERSHFLAWMGIIPRRHKYSNPAISDLYYLHEYLHAGQMRHAADTDRARWSQKIWTNERDASLGSEVYVYFELPNLRPLTFGFEIWADRLLADERLSELHRNDRPGFERELVELRERAMFEPTPGDRSEQLIASYHGLNVEWAEIWAARYLDVERALAHFTELASRSRRDAAQWLVAWANEAKGDHVCPFEDEARAFAQIVATVLR